MGMGPISSKNSGAAVGVLQVAGPLPVGAGERAPGVAEKFGVEQAGGEGGHVDRGEGPYCPGLGGGNVLGSVEGVGCFSGIHGWAFDGIVVIVQ